jgi:hypothetical protein
MIMIVLICEYCAVYLEIFLNYVLVKITFRHYTDFSQLKTNVSIFPLQYTTLNI